MPRGTQKTAVLQEAQRRRILDAAMTVFAQKGVSATMDDVAAAASVSHGLAYRYFASKEELIVAAVERAVREGREAFDAGLEEPGTPASHLATLVTALVRSRVERPELHRLLEHVHDSHAVPTSLRELIRAQGEEVFGRMRAWIVEGQSTGTVHAGDPDEMLTALAASLHGLSHVLVHGGAPFERRSPAPAIFLRMLLPTGAGSG